MSDESIDRSEGRASTPPSEGTPDDDRWLDRPGSVNLIIKVLMVACAVSVVADFFYHKHGDYSFQEWLAFDAVFGFVAYVGLVTVAKGVRRVLMRDEDYYD